MLMHPGVLALPRGRAWRLTVAAVIACLPSRAGALPEIREAFFDAYPAALGSRLETVPSTGEHCGACHYRFYGGGPRNPYGQAVEGAIGAFPYTPEGRRDAILSIDGLDSDGDGLPNGVEITDLAHYLNTPTFPGLTESNFNRCLQVDLKDIAGHLTPRAAPDAVPPANGGESWVGDAAQAITWIAADASDVVGVDLLVSTDGGVRFDPLALGVPNTGSFNWFVHDLPGTDTRVRAVAYDPAGNAGRDESDASFTIATPPGGRLATTLRDFVLPGTQPLGAGVTQSYRNCSGCHGGYDPAVEPEFTWKGSMMAQAARDPLFHAALAIANQDARDSGDLCLRCHTQPGWLGGRSTPPDGSALTAADREGVTCDVCHGMVDPIFEPGVSPPEDLPILAALAAVPPDAGNGMTVVDPSSAKRGPFGDPWMPGHPVVPSPFHREAAMCGTCHNVSNPVFSAAGGRDFVANGLDAAPPSADPYQQFPVERTYGEWLMSEYNSPGGVFAPEFAGNRPDGRVSTCQDCHMRDVYGTGVGDPEAPWRPDLPLHDLTGGNTWMPGVIADLHPGEVERAVLEASAARALAMLELAATLEVEAAIVNGVPVATVRVTNETGHKLPSGYPEGRRMWLNVRAFDAGNALVYESGAYDAATGTLAEDADIRVYEAHLGLSPALASALGLSSGPSFHFVLNDTILKDNRIPPRGFTNAGFAAVQAWPVDPDFPGERYADGQHWDETAYELPVEAVRVEVTLYYQTTSKEYVEFLRDENVTNGAGDAMYAAWGAHGRAAPVAMATEAATVEPASVGGGASPAMAFGLARPSPNPFVGSATLVYRLPSRGTVELAVYDVAGRRMRTLLRGQEVAPGEHRIAWDGRDDAGRAVVSGIYFLRLESGGREALERLILMR